MFVSLISFQYSQFLIVPDSIWYSSSASLNIFAKLTLAEDEDFIAAFMIVAILLFIFALEQ